ncbi:MAG: ATP-binding protein, partial [Candidatus Nomurabacteria bacterium]|nr:ATP-binding protein [Candidatus Nomurabacteria bacterium]
MTREKANLHVMVGLPGSGKTTMAKKIAAETGALRLTCDEWHIRLFGNNPYSLNHSTNHENIEKMLLEVAENVLSNGGNVVVDFGSWSRAERNELRELARRSGAKFIMHYLDVPIDELLRRLDQRNRDFSESEFIISPEKLARYAK